MLMCGVEIAEDQHLDSCHHRTENCQNPPYSAGVCTDQLIEAANATREVFFTRTVLNGRSVLRFSIGGRTTERHHVLSAWGMLQKLA
jgi:hypothetical protein